MPISDFTVIAKNNTSYTSWVVTPKLAETCTGKYHFLYSEEKRRSCVDSEEKLCRLVSEFGRVCKRRKLRVNVGKSKVMRCFRYGNRDRMLVIQNREPLEEVVCFTYLGSQVAANGGCERDVVHRMNEGE